MIPNAAVAPTILPVKRSDKRAVSQVLFLSRIHPKKGLFDLVNAWALIRPARWRLLIVGGSELGHREEVAALIHSCGLQDAIQLAPQVSEQNKWSVYAESDLFVLPSYSENFGVVVAEAMLMGLPVITTTATPWSILEEASCGWHIETGVEPLTATLRVAFDTPIDQLAAMGARGRLVVSERFDWGRIAQQMAGFYSWMVEGGVRPAWVYCD